MSRKSIGVLTVFLLFSLVAAWYYFTNESKYFNTSAFKAIPANSSLILRVKNISAFSSRASGNFILKNFSSFPGISLISKELYFVDSLLQNNPATVKYLSKKDVLLSYGQTAGKMSLIYLVELSDMAEKTTIRNIVRDYFSKRNASNIKQEKGKIVLEIYYWSKGPSHTTFCVSFYKGIFIAGTDPERVFEAARQLDQPSFTDKDDFQKITKTASPNADLNIYINRRNFGKVFFALFSGSWLERIDNGPHNEKWTELDFSFKENEIFLNGFTQTSDSLNDFTELLIHQSPASFDLDKHLPAGTSFFMGLNLKDLSSFLKDYEAFLEKKGKAESYKKSLEEVDTLYHVNLQNLMKNNLNHQVGVFFTNFIDSIPGENRYFIMKVNNENRLDSLLLKFIRPPFTGKGPVFRGLKQEFRVGKDTVFWIYQSPVSNFAERIFGTVFPEVITSYFTICDSCLVMGRSLKSVEDYLTSVNLKETLNKNPLYSDFIAGLSQPLILYLWGKPGYCLPFFHGDINTALFNKLQIQLDTVKKINAAGWLITAEKGMIYNTGRLTYSPQIRNRPVAVWKYKTEDIVVKPQFVINSEEKGKPDVISQDKNNILFLVGNNGLLKWKKKLSYPVISEIYQVNYYKDKRLQFLFNTSKALYLLDGEGKDIQGFPVKFKSKATNGIGVFDYDRTFDYRIFVACEDKNIYVYDRNGTPVSGWQAAPVESPISRPIQFFRVLGRDYIVYTDKGKTYVMDRKGNHRITFQKEFSPSVNNSVSLEPSLSRNQSRFVITAADGMVCLINLDGSIEKVRMGKFSPQHYFINEDINNDGRAEYLFLDGNLLELFDYRGNTVFTKVFPDKIDAAPKVLNLEGKGKKLGILDKKSNQIYILNPDGSNYEESPVEGNTLFDFGTFNFANHRFNLLTGSPDGYLNNYSFKF